MTWVYFIKPIGMDGPIKVGCSRLPAHRLMQIVPWSPFPLEIVCQLPGNVEVERRFHASMIDHWSHSEWFHATPEVLAIVEAAKRGIIPDVAPIRIRSAAYSKIAAYHYVRCGMKLRLAHAKRHALGYMEAHRHEFAEETALKRSADERRPMTDSERNALLELIARLKAMPQHPLGSRPSAAARRQVAA